MIVLVVVVFKDGEIRAAIRADFEEHIKGVTYKSYIPDGPPPLPSDQ